MKNSFLTISFLLLIPTICWGQMDTVSTRIPIVSRVTKDSITLRWAPPDFLLWTKGNTYGYTIEKFLLVRNNVLLSQPQRVSQPDMAVKALPVDEWEKLLKTVPISVVAAQALYGDDFSISFDQADIVEIVNKTKENEQRFSMALYCADNSFEVAIASGLAWTDKNVEPNSKVLYRISVIDPNGTTIGEGSVFVSSNEFTKLPAVSTIKTSVLGNLLTLTVDPEYYQGIYNSFYLEKAYDTTRFEKITELPHTQLEDPDNGSRIFLHDTVNTKAYYRVRGITPFGDAGPPSRIYEIVTEYKIEAIPHITNVETSHNGSMNIQWGFPDGFNKQIKGFRLERAEQNDGAFIVIADSIKNDVREAKDKAPLNSNYYRIVAQGLSKGETVSHTWFAAVADSIAPLAPTGLHGSVDDMGHVKIMWNSNEENDIYGYRLYKAHQRNEEPSLLGRDVITDPSASDVEELNKLDKFVFYYVIAIDRSQNHSPLSSVLKLKLPDKVPPQPPALLPVSSEPDGVKVVWKPSVSEDVAKYELYRKSGNEKEWTLLKSIGVASDSLMYFTDQSVLSGIPYFYTVVAVDSSSQRSDPARPIKGHVLLSLKKPVKLLQPMPDRQTMTVKLKWDYEERGVKAFRVYRKSEEAKGQFVLFRTVGPDDHEWVDSSITSGKSYSYFIIVQHEDLSFSEQSNITSIDF